MQLLLDALHARNATVSSYRSTSLESAAASRQDTGSAARSQLCIAAGLSSRPPLRRRASSCAKLRPLAAQAGRVSRLQPRRAVPGAVTTDERSPRLFDTGRTNASIFPPRGQICEGAWNRASPPLATGTPVLLRDVRGFATNLGSTFRGRVTSRVRRNSSVSTVTDDS